jgi:hypothetical protein
MGQFPRGVLLLGRAHETVGVQGCSEGTYLQRPELPADEGVIVPTEYYKYPVPIDSSAQACPALVPSRTPGRAEPSRVLLCGRAQSERRRRRSAGAETNSHFPADSRPAGRFVCLFDARK